MARTTNATLGKPQNPADFAVREARKAWTLSQTKVDAHSRKCRPCAKRIHPLIVARQTGTLGVIDPYKPCKEAVRLWEVEKAAILAYRQTGGPIPTY